MNLDEFSAQLAQELNRLANRDDVRLVALVAVGDDQVLKRRLAESCAGLKNPVIAVFETNEPK